MKKIFLGLVLMVGLISCSNYGKKIKIEGTKGEVYYKEGVTESDAKKLGEFLKTNSFFKADKGASIQITKEGESYTVRFVYDKKVYDTLKNADNLFKIIAIQASKEVFGGKKMNVALTDNHFKEYKTIAYDEEMAKAMDAPTLQSTDTPTDISGNQTGDKDFPTSQADFKHEKIGDVDFYWFGISDQDSKTIADFIIADGSFNGGTAEIYMIREKDGRYILRFPMIASARTDPSTLAEVDRVSKKIKDGVFANAPYSFYVTDEMMNTIKAYDY